MHTQATYDELGNRMYVETFVSRYMQIKEARQFIQKTVLDNASNYNKEKDIVILNGDFNVNSGKLSDFEQKKIQEL